ncbi:MAG: excisionase [Erysipelotrichia bacterium]|nr:excisionase [Erysipelotrichia bacterium]
MALNITTLLNPAYAPLGIIDYKTGISKKSFNAWWKERSIPASRSKIKDILDSLDMSSSLELLDKCMGLSLSDQYWIKNKDSKVTWEEVNFFTNDFSEDMGELLLGQRDSSVNINLFSPDNSSDGNLRKKWKIINGDRCLIKSGGIYNQEPYNEVVATKLYERLLPKESYTSYTLLEENEQVYSCCKTMVTPNEELVPAWYIDKVLKLKGSDSLYEHYLNACEKLSIPNARDNINKMIVCDFILGNYDRHYRNFGAIRNVNTLKWEKIAPIYDSGSSLCADVLTQQIKSYQFDSKPFKKDCIQQLNLVNDYSWLDINKLKGFSEEVKEILSLNPLMDDNRTELIKRMVDVRIEIVCERKKACEKNN